MTYSKGFPMKTIVRFPAASMALVGALALIALAPEPGSAPDGVSVHAGGDSRLSGGRLVTAAFPTVEAGFAARRVAAGG